jgi:hypothetical protein
MPLTTKLAPKFIGNIWLLPGVSRERRIGRHRQPGALALPGMTRSVFIRLIQCSAP